jgi:cytochrome c biogenesis protein CcmG/thiol:disulfide interchange protein DsbE
MFKYFVPLLIFIGLVVLFMLGLQNDPKLVPSPFIGKPVPEFALPRLDQPTTVLKSTDLIGDTALINIWATWCIPCRQEHPLLMDLAKNSDVKIYGLNYKDVRNDALVWLEQLGNPYDFVLVDEDGRVGIDLGAYGVPETFVIDRHGIIHYKHVGPLNEHVMAEIIIPLIGELNVHKK